MKKYIVPALSLLAAALLWLGWSAYSFLTAPPSREGINISFDAPKGATFKQIALELEKKGLITDATKLRWLARYRRMDTKLQAGRYTLNSGWTPDQILDALASGRPELYRVTIPEGLTWWQTARLLADEGVVKYEDFKDAIFDPEFLRARGVPFASAEGFLMPDTYLFRKPEEDDEAAWRAQSRSIAARMIDNFWRRAAALWGGGEGDAEKRAARPAPDELKKIVILASIVEKETSLPEERARVAGVYANRLEKNMKLQADPTIIYGIGPSFKGAIKRSQLEDAANPYNTYQHFGLPPGPIASFGAEALKAAIYPEKHGYYYFVAKTDGGAHAFSRGLDEHARAVEAYRRQKKSR